MGIGVFSGMMMFWNRIVAMGVQLCEYSKTPELYTLPGRVWEYMNYILAKENKSVPVFTPSTRT